MRRHACSNERGRIGSSPPFLLVLGPVFLLLALLLACPSGHAKGRKAKVEQAPNVVLLIADDLGHGDLGAYGNETILTPSIDRLAEKGMLFTRAYSDGSTCTASRAALLTGMYPARLGLRRMVLPSSRRGIPPGVSTVADLLASRGYETFHIGKWHVGSGRGESQPNHKGFDHYFGFLTIGDSRYTSPKLRTDDGPPVLHDGHMTDLLTERAVEFIRSEHDRPFLLSVSFLAVHKPIVPADRWKERFPDTEDGAYSALVAQLDESVGRIVAALGDAGLGRRTIVIFSSDNGAAGTASFSSGSLRGKKGTFFEGGIRVPLVVSWPGKVAKGARSETPVLLSDFVPTVAEIAGAEVESLNLDSQSILPVLLGDADAATPSGDRMMFWERNADFFAVRHGSWKLVGDDGKLFLFDLANDPREETDLKDRHPARAQALLGEYRDWRVRVGRLPFEVGAREGEVTVSDSRWTFGAEGGRVLLVDDARLDPHDGDFSVSLWIRPAATATTLGAFLLGKGQGWLIDLEPGGRLRASLNRPMTEDGVFRLHSPQPVQPDRWTHVTLTLFGGRRTLATLWIDGRQVASAESYAPAVSDDPVSIGSGAASRPFQGSLAGLEFWNMALTEREIAQAVSRKP